MKKWLLFVAVAAAAAFVAKRLLPAQTKDDGDIVTDVIYDETAKPVQPVEPLAAAPVPPATESSAEENAPTES